MGWELKLSVGVEELHKYSVGPGMTLQACNTTVIVAWGQEGDRGEKSNLG